MAGSEELGLMTARADEQVANLDTGISQVDSQIDSVSDQITGVEGMCETAKNELTGYLDGTKVLEIEAVYGKPYNTPFSVVYGPNYGLISDSTDSGLYDFSIEDSTGGTEYKVDGIHWDNDSRIQKWVDDFAFGSDYLTRSLTSGASYGLYPTLANLQSAKSILQANKNKISDSKTVFQDYI